MSNHFTFTASDGKEIHYWQWLPQGPVNACVQISHGMADHAQRYGNFAEFLCSQGIAVYANDHRGHGKTAGSIENRGYFADRDGWNLVLSDMLQLNGIIHQNHPGSHVILLGHSMGSFLARNYIINHSDTIQACILSGTATHPGLLLNAGLALARLKSWFIGQKQPDALLDKMSFGAFNKNIPNPQTAFDWLTHDTEIVKAYVADDYCGFVCTTGFFIDLLSALKIINCQKNINKVRKDLPLYFFAGSEDPVGNYGKGVEQAVAKFRQAGLGCITVKIYEGGRHEMLNEVNRNQVWRELVEWIAKGNE
jgi:alpha-beta hydrolase superfamily lysophospholipase